MIRRLHLAAVVLLVPFAWPLDAQEAKLQLSKEEKKLVELVNAERKKENLPSLKTNLLLTKLARAHSDNMAKQGKLDHDLDGKTAFQRMREAGYAFSKAGENIAYSEGIFNLNEVMKGWMESKPHRENILNDEYTEFGLGMARNDKGECYYTQVFAKPRPKE